MVAHKPPQAQARIEPVAIAAGAGVRRVALGTRGSPLALAQARELADRIRAAHGKDAPDVTIEVISVAGDRITDRPLAEIGGKGLFTLEIEQQLADGRIDMAVHSSKDMPTQLPAGLELSCFLPREAVEDAFLSPVADSLRGLPAGVRLGSASLRRQALIRRLRPDIEVVPFRGNVQTRLRKLAEGEVAATLLALAGLNRLGLAGKVTALMDAVDFPPAPGQGAIGVETRIGDEATEALLAPVNHAQTWAELACERAFLSVLDGSCRTPIAGLARAEGDALQFHGLILTPDGRQWHEITLEGATDGAAALGAEAGAKLREQAGPHFFADW